MRLRTLASSANLSEFQGGHQSNPHERGTVTEQRHIKAHRLENWKIFPKWNQHLTADLVYSRSRTHSPKNLLHQDETTLRMDSLMSLGAPLKQFTSFVCGTAASTKREATRSQSVRRGSFSRRKSIGRRRSLPCSSQKVPDSWLRVYQAELKRERKRQQAIVAKKNAQRTVRRAHFRSHHCLPRTTAARKPAAATDDSLFGAFQGLSLDGLVGGSQGSPASTAGGDHCKVM